MEITLSKPAEEFVQQQIAKGLGSASAVIEVACKRWMLDEDRQFETDEWRSYVQEKLQEAERGAFRTLTPQDVDAMMDRIRDSVGLKQ